MCWLTIAISCYNHLWMLTVCTLNAASSHKYAKTINCLTEHDVLWLHIILRNTRMPSCFVLTNDDLLLHIICLLIWQKSHWKATHDIIIVYFDCQTNRRSCTNKVDVCSSEYLWYHCRWQCQIVYNNLSCERTMQIIFECKSIPTNMRLE